MSSEPIERAYEVRVVDDWEGNSRWFDMTATSVLDIALYCSRRYPSTTRITNIKER